ncbi:PSP1 domain-containing protein [Luoshenia tenuis]|uniref:PSP1 domain-containing protein n=1 Tax=Luoshenia tenuis TaxID=2763654 RepID=UPI0020166C91
MMSTIVGVRFKQTGKIYFFDPGELEVEVGQPVIVETQRGVEMGKVALSKREVEESQIASPLKKIVRLATAEDEQRVADNARKEKEALPICQQKADKHGLDMRVVDVEYSFDASKIVFFFTAEGRVDFRELVKDLAGTFRARIELRQIGVRDEAKMLGGLGPCGRIVCCNAYLGDFQPVSIKMAKEQNLSLNPTKISGLCGRLICCLKYEQDTYERTIKKMPRVGSEINTPDGAGLVLGNNLVRERVKVRIPLPDGTFDLREYSIAEINRGPVERRAEGEKEQEPRPERPPRPQNQDGPRRPPRERMNREPREAHPAKEAGENHEAREVREARQEKTAGQRRGSRGGNRSRRGGARPPRRDGPAPEKRQDHPQQARTQGARPRPERPQQPRQTEGQGEKEMRRGGYRSGQI